MVEEMRDNIKLQHMVSDRKKYHGNRKYFKGEQRQRFNNIRTAKL